MGIPSREPSDEQLYEMHEKAVRNAPDLGIGREEFLRRIAGQSSEEKRRIYRLLQGIIHGPTEADEDTDQVNAALEAAGIPSVARQKAQEVVNRYFAWRRRRSS